MAHASKLALGMDTRFGLGSLGPLWIAGQDAAFMRDPEFRDRVPFAIAQKLDPGAVDEQDLVAVGAPIRDLDSQCLCRRHRVV